MKLSYANVIATLALFVALAGTGAYAAGQLAPRSVGERQLRPGAVTAEKLRKSAVTAPKLKAEAVKQGKLANGAVVGAKLAKGAVASATLADGAVTNPRLANGAVTGEKVDEATLSQVPSAARADLASSAESANPMAFAAIDAEGNPTPSLSKGAVSSARPSPGVYCISAPFNPRGAQVTLRNAGDGDLAAFATIGGTESCPAPAVEVRTFKGVLTPAAFYVVLYR